MVVAKSGMACLVPYMDRLMNAAIDDKEAGISQARLAPLMRVYGCAWSVYTKLITQCWGEALTM